jgi:hypothetical protein
MSDSSLLVSTIISLGLFLILISFVLAGARALLMLKGLNVRTYRNQATGLAGVALYQCFLFLWVAFGPSPFVSTALTWANAAVILGVPVVVMIWIDATVKVARKSDPFERDSLHYSAVRYIWFAAVAFLVALGFIYDPIALVLNVSVPLQPAIQVLGYAPVAVAFSFGAILILTSAVRSKDRTLHAHLRWFGLFLLSFTTTFVLTVILKLFFGGNYQLIGLGGVTTYLEFVLFATLGGYFLYRSAGSLALTTNELDAPPSQEPQSTV